MDSFIMPLQRSQTVFGFPVDCVAVAIYGVCQGRRVGFLMDLDGRMSGSQPMPIGMTV